MSGGGRGGDDVRKAAREDYWRLRTEGLSDEQACRQVEMGVIGDELAHVTAERDQLSRLLAARDEEEMRAGAMVAGLRAEVARLTAELESYRRWTVG